MSCHCLGTGLGEEVFPKETVLTSWPLLHLIHSLWLKSGYKKGITLLQPIWGLYFCQVRVVASKFCIMVPFYCYQA